jgi:VWFA-related protein
VKSLLLAVLLLLQAVISVHSELVAVPVIVTDGRGHRVAGLNADDFRVFDDGRPQPITAFHHGDAPITIGLIVDRSRSMRSKTAALRTAVSALLGSSRPDDELFAIVFNDTVSPALAGDRLFTGNVEELQTALSAVPAEGLTALYDGVAAGLQRLQLGHAGKRALIVVSDGGDNASRRTYDGIVTLTQRSDAVIYAIGLLGVSGEDEEDAALLKRLCKHTGGVAYFPRSVEQVAAASMQVARDLRDQYTLGFVPGEWVDRRPFRKIEVTVTAPGQRRLNVRTRTSYVVAGDQQR